MVVKSPRACKSCGYISEEETCPLCGHETSRNWQGYLIIIDYTKSSIAKKMGVQANGKFALRVR